MHNIVFVGDSYCATYDLNQWKSRGYPAYQHGAHSDLHTSLVADHFNCALHPHGYGGKSWWYSRQKYRGYYVDGHKVTDTRAVIFFHTSAGRIHNAWNEKLTNSYENSSLKQYYLELHDQSYYDWAYQQWFREIARDHTQVKTIHFHCYPDTINWSDLLPGMIYTTPLIQISIGELQGTDDAILKKCSYDETRFNHLNAHNNRALANLIIHSIENYLPGQYKIDLTNFDQINPNAKNYPNSGFGTE